MRKRRIALAALALAIAAGVAAIAHGVLGPDPQKQAQRDGCARSRTDEFNRLAPGWVYVNDGDYASSGPPPPVRRLAGIVDAARNLPLDAHPSGGDDPTTHNAFDFNMNIRPDPGFDQLLGGNPEERTGNFEGEGEETGRVHIERELTPRAEFAWPEAGDHVVVTGSWVWDCGHWDPGGERTELHPYRSLWTARVRSPRSPYGDAEGDLYISTDATPAGVIAECGHKTRGDKQAYRACTHTQPNWLDVSGDYDYVLKAPPRPPGAKRLVVRVVNRGSTIGVEHPRVTANGARLRFHLAAKPDTRLVLAEQVFVGWRPAQRVVHLRVAFTKLLTRRSMDPTCSSCPNPESTLNQQIVRPPGEWLVYTDTDGIWRQWPRVYPAREGRVFAPNVHEDLYLPAGRPWRLFVFTHECDFGTLSWSVPTAPMKPCPRSGEFGNFSGDDVPGLVVRRFASPIAAVGTHTFNGSTSAPSTCPASNKRGCFALTVHISRVR